MACVLVCESERHISRLIQVNLERQGHEVHICSEGDSCLRILRERTVDALVIGEPDGMTADEVLTVVQEDPAIHARVMVLCKRPGSSLPPQGPFGGSPPTVISSPVVLQDMILLLGGAVV